MSAEEFSQKPLHVVACDGIPEATRGGDPKAGVLRPRGGSNYEKMGAVSFLSLLLQREKLSTCQ